MSFRIGLEIHVQLTEAGTKLFCGCKSNYRGLPPNTNVCPVCLGLPGALPVPRRRPLVLAVAAALMIGCDVPETITFSRKHYFYPDLPKNYQITQFHVAGGSPICLGGRLWYYDPDADEWRAVRIRRINVEEDPGRTEYEGSITSSEFAYIDYNRSGVPLIEVVTEPEVRSPRDARRIVEYLLLSLEYIGATNPRLEGSFRVDANVSVEGGERVEVKNIGSTLDIERALRYEIYRQTKIIAQGGTVKRETRAWDPVRRITKPLRAKEAEEDYLYFPEPDIPPLSASQLIKEARPLLSMTPARLMSIVEKMGVDRKLAWSLITVRPALLTFLSAVDEGAEPRLAARMLAIDLKGLIRKLGKDVHSPSSWPPPASVVALTRAVVEGRYTYDELKYSVLQKIAANPLIDVNSVMPPRPSDLLSAIYDVLAAEKRAVNDYMNGKAKAIDYLVGAVLRKLRGMAVDPVLVRRLIVEALSGHGA